MCPPLFLNYSVCYIPSNSLSLSLKFGQNMNKASALWPMYMLLVFTFFHLLLSSYPATVNQNPNLAKVRHLFNNLYYKTFLY